MNTPLRTMQVGWGSAGRRRGRIIAESALAELVCIVEAETVAAAESPDTDAPKRPPDTPWRTSLKRAIAEFQPQAAIISAPHHLHHPMMQECIDAGIHVLCEKPAGVGPAELHACVDAAHRAGLVLQVAGNHLFFPSVIAQLEWLRDRPAGPLREAQIRVGHGRLQALPAWMRDAGRSGGGTLRDNGFHGVLLATKALALFGDRILRTRASAEFLNGESAVDVATSCRFTTEQGGRIELNSRWIGAEPYEFKALFRCADGEVEINGPCEIRFAGAGEPSRTRTLHSDDPTASWREDTLCFLNAILGRGAPNVSGAEALECARVVEASYASLRGGAGDAVEVERDLAPTATKPQSESGMGGPQ